MSTFALLPLSLTQPLHYSALFRFIGAQLPRTVFLSSYFLLWKA
ncbi:hypothetical protein Q4I32_000297 [Leishmania shawi]|uniref:Uncharacterized protein n=1 Tax=Leishmania shawi TaxID=5680 RepID=A0AAW3CBP9_9TRYP